MSFKQTEYGKISQHFSCEKLSNLCEDKIGVQTGPFGSQLHKKDYVDSGTPIITVEHLGENFIIHQNTPFVSDSDRKRLIKYSLREGDIVFSRVGSVDRRALVKRSENGWLFSGRCLRVRAKKELIDPVYLSYFFGAEGFKTYIRNIAVGATMPSINTKILSNLPIYFPKLDIQKKIGILLQSIDKKIELNNQINQTLEAMAQALFKSWFVDFKPVKAKVEARAAGADAEGVTLAAMEAISGQNTDALAKLAQTDPEHYAELKSTAELFPDTLVESELGEIPAGWEVHKVKKILQRLKPKKRYTKKQVLNYGRTPVLEQGSKIVMGFHNESPGFYASSNDPVFIFGDHTCITYLSCQPFDISQNVIPLKGANLPTLWVYYSVKDLQKFQEYRRHWSELIVKDIVTPNPKLACLFSTKISIFYKIIENNLKEVANLELLRDTLLPRLLSGELSVEDIELSEFTQEYHS